MLCGQLRETDMTYYSGHYKTCYDDNGDVAPDGTDLIGQWKFDYGAESKDTGLGDGIRQNGDFENGAYAYAGYLKTDGYNDYFEVNGDDDPFDLDEGTIELEFTQYDHIGSSPDTLVSRGEYDDRASEGFLDIRVTEDGRVEVEHWSNGEMVTLSTEAGFFEEGDRLALAYSWDKDSGVTLKVANQTQGTETTIDDDTTGLDLDIGDNDGESFTFAARESDDGDYDHYFKGKIDYVQVRSTGLEDVGGANGDGTVHGTNGDDLIDLAYDGDPEGDKIDNEDAILPGHDLNDDLVVAGKGDDSVTSLDGDDTVYGGAGNDEIDGGVGNDILYGDKDLGNASTTRESFEWDKLDDPDGSGAIDNGDGIWNVTQNTGSVNVTFKKEWADHGTDNTFSDSTQYVDGIDGGGETVDADSGFLSELNGGSYDAAKYKMTFDEEVQNLDFRINDIDGSGKVTVLAYDANGNPVEVTFTEGQGLDVNGNQVFTADSHLGVYHDEDSAKFSTLVEIAGPVSRIEILHEEGAHNSGIWLSDVYFDVDSGSEAMDGVGNDSLYGGEGEDEIYGGAGDDYIEGGDGNDYLVGDGDACEGGETDFFEERAQDISNVVLYFDRDGDGEIDYSVKIDGFPDGGTATHISNDLDDYFGQMLDYVYSEHPELEGTAVTAGVSIKGGTEPTQYYAVDGNTNGSLPDAGPTDNTGPGPDDTLQYSDFYSTYDPSEGPGSGTAGTTFNDTIHGGAGDDSIEGNCGDDYIDGGEGDDVMSGGAGNDRIIGGDGNDLAYGGDGDDDMDDVMGSKNDNADNDTYYGGAGNDSIYTGLGDDELYGGIGNDIVRGEAGNDTAHGDEGDDDVRGGDGEDTLYGGAGSDLMSGGNDNDVIHAGNSTPWAFDEPYPGLGAPDAFPDNDKDDVYGGGGDDVITTGDDDDTIYGGAGNDSIDAGIDDDTVFGDSGDDTITGGEGEDELHGDHGDDLIYGGLDNDTLDLIDDLPDGDPLKDALPGNNMDTIYGGTGNDTLYGRDDDDEIHGGRNDDTIYGGIDDDTLYGGEDQDEIYGGQGNDVITGGEDADKLFGGADEDTFLGGSTDDHVIGGEDTVTGIDYDVLDLTGNDVVNIDYDDAGVGGGAGDAESGRVYFSDGTTMTFEEIERVIPCFTPGTLIATPRGERLVEELKVGDRIITRDNGIQEIRWVGQKVMKGTELVKNAQLRPILIKAGSLGAGLPERDMLVSPSHRVLVSDDRTQLYFDEREVLAAAKHLVGTPGIQAVDVMSTTYIHFMFDQHEVVLSNGCWTESFQPGDYSLKGIDIEQRQEIYTLFPELREASGLEGYTAARKSLKRHEARLLVK